MERKKEDDRRNKAFATDVLVKVLLAMHEKRYSDIPVLFDDIEWNDMSEVQELVESRTFDSVDEYGAPCDFNPPYQYSQLEFYDYNDDSGFRLEYDLTTGSELMYLSLQLEFIYTDKGIKKRFLTVDSR